MKKIGICIGISFLFFSCSSPSETSQEKITPEVTTVTQTVSADGKYTQAMKHITLAEERRAFDSSREYHKEQCGEGVMYYDLGSSVDGPIYYIDTKNKKILAERGGCGMSPDGCFGEILEEWTCNK